MAIIVRRNGGRGGIIPYFRPGSFLDKVEWMRKDLWNDLNPSFLGGDLLPQTDIYEENGELIVKTELPGIKKEDIAITLDGDVLTIKAEKKEAFSEEATHHSSERRYGTYVRTVQLPHKVNEDTITASLADGILELNLPRAEETKAKQITIKEQSSEPKTNKTTTKPEDTAE